MPRQNFLTLTAIGITFILCLATQAHADEAYLIQFYSPRGVEGTTGVPDVCEVLDQDQTLLCTIEPGEALAITQGGDPLVLVGAFSYTQTAKGQVCDVEIDGICYTTQNVPLTFTLLKDSNADAAEVQRCFEANVGGYEGQHCWPEYFVPRAEAKHFLIYNEDAEPFSFYVSLPDD